MPNHYIGDLLHTIKMSGFSRVRTELLQLTVVVALAPHPVQVHRQLPRHRYLGDLPTASHGEVEKFAAPLRLAAYRDLRRFDQQKAQQCIASFAEVNPIGADRRWTLLSEPDPHSWRSASHSESRPRVRN